MFNFNQVRNQFQTPSVAVADNVNYVPIGDPLNVAGQIDDVFLSGIVLGANALTHFKITWAAYLGGPHSTLLADADFAAVGPKLDFSTPTPHTTAPNAEFKIYLKKLLAVAEIRFWAQSIGCTLQITGTIARPQPRTTI